ncbi:MAG: hypothetical protein H5U12_27170 [Hoeflea sp.]|nr:hypothetical protein [Hoeflea sp.]
MKRSRFKEGQIIGIVKEQEADAKAAGVCRKRGNLDANFPQIQGEGWRHGRVRCPQAEGPGR